MKRSPEKLATDSVQTGRESVKKHSTVGQLISAYEMGLSSASGEVESGRLLKSIPSGPQHRRGTVALARRKLEKQSRKMEATLAVRERRSSSSAKPLPVISSALNSSADGAVGPAAPAVATKASLGLPPGPLEEHKGVDPAEAGGEVESASSGPKPSEPPQMVDAETALKFVERLQLADELSFDHRVSAVEAVNALSNGSQGSGVLGPLLNCASDSCLTIAEECGWDTSPLRRLAATVQGKSEADSPANDLAGAVTSQQQRVMRLTRESRPLARSKLRDSEGQLLTPLSVWEFTSGVPGAPKPGKLPSEISPDLLSELRIRAAFKPRTVGLLRTLTAVARSWANQNSVTTASLERVMCPTVATAMSLSPRERIAIDLLKGPGVVDAIRCFNGRGLWAQHHGVGSGRVLGVSGGFWCLPDPR